jgi:hypothetical protein
MLIKYLLKKMKKNIKENKFITNKDKGADENRNI